MEGVQRRRLIALADDPRLGAAAARLLDHPHYEEERLAC